MISSFFAGTAPSTAPCDITRRCDEALSCRVNVDEEILLPARDRVTPSVLAVVVVSEAALSSACECDPLSIEETALSAASVAVVFSTSGTLGAGLAVALTEDDEEDEECPTESSFDGRKPNKPVKKPLLFSPLLSLEWCPPLSLGSFAVDAEPESLSGIVEVEAALLCKAPLRGDPAIVVGVLLNETDDGIPPVAAENEERLSSFFTSSLKVLSIDFGSRDREVDVRREADGLRFSSPLFSRSPVGVDALSATVDGVVAVVPAIVVGGVATSPPL